MFSRKLRIRAKELFLYDPEPLELYLGLRTLVWGIWLATPIESFMLRRQYWFLMDSINEIFYGLGSSFLGLVVLLAVIQGRKSLRSWAMLLTFCFWLFLAVAFGLTEPELPIVATYSLTALASMWCYWRLVWR